MHVRELEQIAKVFGEDDSPDLCRTRAFATAFMRHPPRTGEAIAHSPTLNLESCPSQQAEALRKIVASDVFEPLIGRGEHLICCDVPEKFIEYLT